MPQSSLGFKITFRADAGVKDPLRPVGQAILPISWELGVVHWSSVIVQSTSLCSKVALMDYRRLHNFNWAISRSSLHNKQKSIRSS